MGIAFVSLPALVASSDVITLHCPLTPKTCRLIDAEAIAQMERRPMLINTSRGALIDATAVQQIAEVTIENLDRMEVGESTGTEVTVHLVG
jgi:lactate dehydrogenase-like 2-hydroxyacid dehydrogenase